MAITLYARYIYARCIEGQGRHRRILAFVSYDDQHRGDRGAYERYLRGMDATMKQKVALTAAHILCRGRVADMGMGSGAGSEALAALYPEMDVVGVDVDPKMVELAREKYTRKNLSFVVGDVAASVFPDGALDAIFDSSVLHHVTSFGGYVYDNAGRAIETQARELAPHGVLVIRDFVAPVDGTVLLDLPADDGDDSKDPKTCSTAALFERFAREFRSLHERPGLESIREAQDPRPGWRRYRLSRRHAVEFVLRKDYRTDWVGEVKEEYGYFTQREFEADFERLGLRLLASTPLRNPWIVRNRFEGRFVMRDLDGAPLDWPATNYVIVGEKVHAGEGVQLREAGEAPRLGFLEMTHWRRAGTGEVRDLVRRPNTTFDVLPWFEAWGDVFVLGRMSYPRPILASGAASLDGARAPTYVTEPLTVLQGDKPLGQTVEEALVSIARIEPHAIVAFQAAGTYYPSPGGVQEEVRSVHVRVSPVFVEERIANVSGFSTSGRVRALEAQQLLRAAQVGGLPDARLELNVYELLLRLGRDVGPWIGEAIAVADGEAPHRPATMAALRGRLPRRAWARAEKESSPGFLDLRCARFEEFDAAANVVARAALELVTPRPVSSNSIAAALLRSSGGDAWIGLDDDDLPAAQCFHGNSQILVAPAWRLPRALEGMNAARDWLRERLAREYGVRCGEIWELGGRYHPSAGVTPEVVYPLAVHVTGEGEGARGLRWVRVRDAVENLADLTDGHLRVVALRAAHALGLLSS
jgi:SAM-dependent methyltransferase